VLYCKPKYRVTNDKQIGQTLSSDQTAHAAHRSRKGLAPYYVNLMCSSTLAVRKTCFLAVACILGALATPAHSALSPQGGEYRVIGSWPGEQLFADISIVPSGGYIVWHDNAIDGNGHGIGARRLDASLSGTLASFRVNEIVAGDQENAKVAMLDDGGAVFVWQGGPQGAQRIYARFMAPNGAFVTGDIRVNTYNQNFQIDPDVARLADGNVIVVWASYGQDGDLLGVFGQRLSPIGEKLGPEFQVNTSTANNQRSPAVLALPDGRFMVFWISESFRTMANQVDASGRASDPSAGGMLFDIDLGARIYAADGTPLTIGYRVNSSQLICANPTAAVAADGNILVAWSGRSNELQIGGPRPTEGWDVYARRLAPNGAPLAEEFRLNQYRLSQQYLPSAAAAGDEFLVAWISFGQDGSREGIYARTVHTSGTMTDEFRVNTFTYGRQLYPAVASDGNGRFLTVWSSFVGGTESLDLFAQRFAASPALPPPAAPYVSALSQTRLSVTWPDMAGFDVASYEIYANGVEPVATVDGNIWNASNLQPGATYAFRLAYRLVDGRRSPLSVATTGRTWGADENFDGLPDDWQALYWGNNPAKWPGAHVDSDGDGATNLQEFLAGTDPTDPASVLRIEIVLSGHDRTLVWNSQPGLLYQLQISSDGSAWSDVGSHRLATGHSDSIPIESGASVQMYRVIRLR
jgi:hypothetical protein